MTKITEQTIAAVMGELSMMRCFPGDPDTRASIIAMLCKMASNAEQLFWLTQRMNVLYAEWPGAREMRACFCSKFKPRDGVEVYSTVYLDGIPSERKTEPVKALSQPQAAALLAEVSAWDECVEAEVRDGLYDREPIPAAPKPVRKPRVIEALPPFPSQPITEADVLAAERARSGGAA